MDPDSCEAIDADGLPFADIYRYSSGDALDLPVDIPGRNVWVNLSRGKASRKGNQKKLFKRAIVKSIVEEGRICVEYPSGSTYKVRSQLLDGILTDSLCRELPTLSTHNVLLYRETHDYRRACVVHCGPDEAFCEIGCAEGITCDRIWKMGIPDRIPIGIDKSTTCIHEANQRYPECTFLEADIFEEDFDWKAYAPQVVAIDINGTRELEAVLASIKLVLLNWKPRLVLVKARSLYHAVTKEKDGGSTSK